LQLNLCGWRLAFGGWQIVLRNEFEQPKFHWDKNLKNPALEKSIVYFIDPPTGNHSLFIRFLWILFPMENPSSFSNFQIDQSSNFPVLPFPVPVLTLTHSHPHPFSPSPSEGAFPLFRNFKRGRFWEVAILPWVARPNRYLSFDRGFVLGRLPRVIQV
jgi:hypothetical protein